MTPFGANGVRCGGGVPTGTVMKVGMVSAGMDVWTLGAVTWTGAPCDAFGVGAAVGAVVASGVATGVGGTVGSGVGTGVGAAVGRGVEVACAEGVCAAELAACALRTTPEEAPAPRSAAVHAPASTASDGLDAGIGLIDSLPWTSSGGRIATARPPSGGPWGVTPQKSERRCGGVLVIRGGGTG